MTEIDWLSLHDPVPLLRFLRGRNDLDRKLRLFAVACCAPFVKELPGPYFAEALDCAERYADLPSSSGDEEGEYEARDGVADADVVSGQREGSIAQAINQTLFMAQPAYLSEANVDLCESAERVSRLLIDASQSPDRIRNSYALRAAERLFHSNLIRDIFGNPFRPVAIDPRWLTSTVLDLARTIYDERLPERMPILADALMDAGCDNEEIISHCRSEELHVRGCWVVDLLYMRDRASGDSRLGL